MFRLLLTLFCAVLCAADTIALQQLRPATRTVAYEGGGYFPVAIRLRTGEILVVCRGGAPHVGVKGRLDLLTSRDEGRTWSRQTVVDSEFDDRNPALGEMPDGSVVLAYAVASGYNESGETFKSGRDKSGWLFDGVYTVRSTDRGATWSKPERSEPVHQFYAGKGLVSPYGKMVTLPDGTVLMSVYFHWFAGPVQESYVFRSQDNGRTWGEPSRIGRGFNETGITVLPSGEVIAGLRSQVGGSLSMSRSGDQGRTWSAPVPLTADLEHPADLLPLRDGRVLLTYSERSRPFGVRALLSKDGGKTWPQDSLYVLTDSAANIDCGYPSSVQLPDGRVLTVYYQVEDEKQALATASARVVIWQP